MPQIKKILLFLCVVCATAFLGGCNKYGTYLNRTDATGAAVTYPLDGILSGFITDNDVIWSEPDTSKTIDAVFDTDPSSTKPSHRYFQYAKGIPIAQYKVGEGVNIVKDGTYKGNQNIDGDTNSLPMIVPIEKISLRSYDKDRWSSDPEIYTIGEDYLYCDNCEYSPLFDATAQQPVEPPAVILVLYEPSTYAGLDATQREYNSEPMYFDAYYSVDYWNIINDDTDTISAPNISNAKAKTLLSPTKFGICAYASTPPSTLNSTVINSVGTNVSADKPKILIHTIFGCIEESATYLADPTANSDITFTLFDAIGKPGEDAKITQNTVNKWTKYDFIEMLSSSSATTFNLANDIIDGITKNLYNKEEFSKQNNLQVPVILYSEQAYNVSMANCPEEPDRALRISQYDVEFTGNNPTYYHNRSVLFNKTLYEKQPAGNDGARPTVTSTDPLDWVWCWFTPE